MSQEASSTCCVDCILQASARAKLIAQANCSCHLMQLSSLQVTAVGKCGYGRLEVADFSMCNPVQCLDYLIMFLCLLFLLGWHRSFAL